MTVKKSNSLLVTSFRTKEASIGFSIEILGQIGKYEKTGQRRELKNKSFERVVFYDS